MSGKTVSDVKSLLGCVRELTLAATRNSPYLGVHAATLPFRPLPLDRMEALLDGWAPVLVGRV